MVADTGISAEILLHGVSCIANSVLRINGKLGRL